MSEANVAPRIIADCLVRTEEAVNAKVWRHRKDFQKCNEAPLYEGPQTLSLELEDSIFHSRLLTIWEGLMTFSKTRKWGKTLSNSASELWFPLLMEHTQKRFRSMLASHQPPNLARLESLEWSDTTAAGVHGCTSKLKGKSFYSENEYCLYVGSASDYGRSLSGRRSSILSTWPSTRNDAFKFMTKDHGLSPKRKFITFLEVPFKGGGDEEVGRIRSLAILAKAVFAIWLGAVRESSKPAIKELAPWAVENVRYLGLANHNP